MVARTPARHNAAQRPCSMRTPQKQRAALPLRLRDGSCLSAFDLECAVEASLTGYVRLPHRVRVEWWRATGTDRFTRGRWCARFLEFRAVSSATWTINAATASVGCRLMTPLSDLHPRLRGDVRRFIAASRVRRHSRSATRARCTWSSLCGGVRTGWVRRVRVRDRVSFVCGHACVSVKRCVEHFGPRPHFLRDEDQRGPQRRSSKAPEPARMVKNKGKGGKNRRRGKADGDMKRELTFKEDGQGAR